MVSDKITIATTATDQRTGRTVGVCRSHEGNRAESRGAVPLPPTNHHVVQHRDGQAGLPLIANV
jgi:hypothetical protein